MNIIVLYLFLYFFKGVCGFLYHSHCGDTSLFHLYRCWNTPPFWEDRNNKKQVSVWNLMSWKFIMKTKGVGLCLENRQVGYPFIC